MNTGTVTQVNDQGQVLDSAQHVLTDNRLVVVGMQSDPGSFRIGLYKGGVATRTRSSHRGRLTYEEQTFQVEWLWGDKDQVGKTATLTVGSRAWVLAVDNISDMEFSG